MCSLFGHDLLPSHLGLLSTFFSDLPCDPSLQLGMSLLFPLIVLATFPAVGYDSTQYLDTCLGLPREAEKLETLWKVTTANTIA